MQLRRVSALAIGAVLLTAPLSACGFSYSTDKVYTPAMGANDRDATVDVLGAVIVSAQEGSGTFIASFANNNIDKSNTVEEVIGTDTSQEVTSKDFEPITIEKNSLVNLAQSDQGTIEVTGQFAAGDFVPLRITFGNGESARLQVPVVTNCGIWGGLDGPGSTQCTTAAPASDPASESPSEVVPSESLTSPTE